MSPIDKKFRPTYDGNQWERDTAYRQGTTWPFPMGDYFLALFNIKPNDPNTKTDFLETMEHLEQHFYNEDGLHGISEVFDGIHPTKGKGCIHQAWSVSTFVHVLQKRSCCINSFKKSGRSSGLFTVSFLAKKAKKGCRSYP